MEQAPEPQSLVEQELLPVAVVQVLLAADQLAVALVLPWSCPLTMRIMVLPTTTDK